MHIDCPSCGSRVDLNPSDRILKCAYCDSVFRVDLGESIPSLTLKTTIPPGRVSGLIKDALKHRELFEQIQILNVQRILFPFWQFSFPQKSWITPAAASSDEALSKFRLKAGEKSYFELKDEDSDAVIAPDIFLETAFESMGKAFAAQHRREEAKLAQIFVPFYKVRFSYGEQDYTCYVAGHSGEILFDKLPTISALAAGRPLIVRSVLIFLLFTIITLVTLNVTSSIPATLIACFGTAVILFFYLKLVVVE